MNEQHHLNVIENTNRKQRVAEDQLAFGKEFTDHMFVMDYSTEKGWHHPRITPYEPITLDPAAMIFHYGQTVFEGLKAYRTEDDRILLFRPEKNFQRMNRSSERLSIPLLDEKLVLTYLEELLRIEKEWVPKTAGYSLYIRPFIIATEPNLSLAPSNTYQFYIILSPVGSYYREGIHPVKIFVEEEFTRAVRGGTGMAKTAGNYSAAYIAQQRATDKGYSQVLWLDGVEKKYIEEVGSMNVFFKIGEEVVTPLLNGSILEGITRLSIIELLKDWNVPVVERRVSIEEIFQAHKEGIVEEVFGTGTAAVVSPVGELTWNDEQMIINNGHTGKLSKKLYETLTAIQTGKQQDPYGWTVEIKE
ncbi:branched-chain amino acid aminotransferase [Alkalihalobacterium chitinilyticum]|uniref:Branched-chain-amino-acid aminotransferase n=1 Tax=Alkalihalobacterium chitinilyticum TaxID=2980103 RepID=A0ABT5V8N7_9BACI|nr:branched-chain amino acid aminotransferase [Alkalihalobacterium chitinilyticum]MDE5411816.1 branched-chain amino acid aminotransferase [Alkalihalobacterium chitinilyticum]